MAAAGRLDTSGELGNRGKVLALEGMPIDITQALGAKFDYSELMAGG